MSPLQYHRGRDWGRTHQIQRGTTGFEDFRHRQIVRIFAQTDFVTIPCDVGPIDRNRIPAS